MQLELHYVLQLWLKEIPEYVLVFVRYMLVNALLESVSNPLTDASQATGNIWRYQIVTGSVTLLNIPIALLLLHLKFPAASVQILGIILTFIAFIAQIVILSRQLRFSLWHYFNKIIIPVILVLIMGSIIPGFLVLLFPAGLLRLFMTVTVSILSVTAAIYTVGLSGEERVMVMRVVKNRVLNRKTRIRP